MREKKVYIVQKGDTLYSIAEKFNTTVDQLIELNLLPSTLIVAGQELIIGASNNQETSSTNYSEFIKNMEGVGELKVKTVVGNTYYPVENAYIQVFKQFNDGHKEFFSGYTDSSGIIDKINLPTYKKREDYTNGAAIYQLKASHDGYQTSSTPNVYIYDGIKSIQQITMLPIDYYQKKGNNYENN